MYRPGLGGILKCRIRGRLQRYFSESRRGGIKIVIEVKYSETDKLEEECNKALRQIENKKSDAVLLDDGMTKMMEYGIASYKKHCKVITED